MKTKKMTLLALLAAIALTIFMIEAQIPSPVPIPGVKLGLANIVTVFTVFVLGPKEGAAVLAVRVFLGAVFAGNFSTILYSAARGRLCHRRDHRPAENSYEKAALGRRMSGRRRPLHRTDGHGPSP